MGRVGVVDGAGTGPPGGTGKRGTAQDTSPSTPTIMAVQRTKRENTAMVLLLLEALGALLILVFIVWWTMFSGRKNGELKTDAKPGAESAAPAKTDESL
jgi:hypothetical protein